MTEPRSAAAPPAPPARLGVTTAADEPERVELGHGPRLLDPATAWAVASGRAEIFAVLVERDGEIGHRRFLLAAESGEALWGLGRDDGEGRTLRTLAVGEPGTVLQRMRPECLRDALAAAAAPRPASASSPAAAAAAAVDLVEGWLRALAPALVADGARPPPKSAERLAPAPEPHRLAGTPVQADDRPVWLRHLEGSSRPLGEAELSQLSAGQPPFPLVRPLWLEPADAGGAAQLQSTAELHSGGELPGALLAFHDIAAAHLIARRRQELEADRARLLARAEQDRALVSASLGRLAALVDDRAGSREVSSGSGSEAISAAEAGTDPLFAAVRWVCDASGIAIPGRAEVGAPRAQDARDPLEALARALRLRTRQVALAGRWWREDHGPLVAFRAEAEGRARAPVALLPGRRGGGYLLRDPAAGAGAPVPVTPELAEGLEPFATVFYRRLPERPLGFGDLIRFGVFGLRREVVTTFAAGLLAGVLGLATPVATGLLFSDVVPHAERPQLVHLFAGLVLAAFATAAFNLSMGLTILRMEGRLGQALQAAIWDRLLDLPVVFFRDYSSGDLALRAQGSETIRRTLSAGAVRAVLAAGFALINGALLLYYDVRLALWALGLVAVSVAFSVYSGRAQARLQARVSALQGRLSSLLLDLLGGIAKLRVSGAEPRAFARWAGLFSQQRRVTAATRGPLQIHDAVYPLLCSGLLFWLAENAPAGQRLAAGTWVAFAAAFAVLLGSTLQASQELLRMLAVAPAAERLQPILAAAPEVSGAGADPGELTGAIEIAHVHFRYRDDGPLVLDDVSLTIRPGEFVAVVGTSGSGKSTLFRMLLGFETPSAGTVSYDGRDLAKLDVRAVRHQLGVVLQNGKLISGSILENIVGSSSLTADDAIRAARMAGFDQDIDEMPMGLHTVVSEGGSTLSGGQRQRLMIARALVRRPRILLFDEATSALDNQTQRIVSQSVERLEATRVVIAHRLSTIERADRIVVMERGRVVQVGTRAELLAQPGPFLQLASRQMLRGS